MVDPRRKVRRRRVWPAIYDAANSGRDDAVVLVTLLIVLLVWWIFVVVRWRKEHRV